MSSLREKYSMAEAFEIGSSIMAAWMNKIDSKGPSTIAFAEQGATQTTDDQLRMVGILDNCPMCAAGQDMEEDDIHYQYHTNALQNKLFEANKKLQDLYENNIDNDLSADEMKEFMEEIDSILNSAKAEVGGC